ncbi:MAG: polyprenyl synthetase family protein [Anaerolineales bacterium]|nr:polyprenyl synthetase family protein [Anaerolineales bacterium]
MTIYDETAQYLTTLPVLANWPEMGTFLISAAANEPHDWWLPVLASVAVGGDQAIAIPGVASIAALQASIILIDDMLDADPRGRHQQIGMPATANMASALQAVSLAAIYQAGQLPAERKAAIMHSLGQMMGQIAWGQQLDVQNPADEAGYWRVVQTKSAPFFSMALYIGALCGGADAAIAGQLAALGSLYGEMIQIHDDLMDTMAEPAGPDWLLGRSPLPILFALTVPHPERDLFSGLRYQVRNPAALRLAQEILVRCGAVSYAVDQILQRYAQAQKLLSTIALPQPDKLAELFTALVEPVEALIGMVNNRPVAVIE